jgi:hypothetical protein
MKATNFSSKMDKPVLIANMFPCCTQHPHSGGPIFWAACEEELTNLIQHYFKPQQLKDKEEHWVIENPFYEKRGLICFIGKTEKDVLEHLNSCLYLTRGTLSSHVSVSRSSSLQPIMRATPLLPHPTPPS